MEFFSFAIGRTEVTSRVEEVPIDDTMLSEICPDAGKQKKICTLKKLSNNKRMFFYTKVYNFFFKQRQHFAFPKSTELPMENVTMSKIQCGV